MNRKQDIAKITQIVLVVITQECNEILINPIELQEVEDAMHQMTLGKVSGMNGFPSNFFHYFGTS